VVRQVTLEECTVFFLDYGHEEIVANAEDVFVCRQELLQMPPLAEKVLRLHICGQENNPMVNNCYFFLHRSLFTAFLVATWTLRVWTKPLSC